MTGDEVVLDASVVVQILTEPRPSDMRTRLRGLRLHAPHLVDAEVGSVLRRRVAAGAIEAGTAEVALRALGGTIHRRHDHRALAGRAWALRHNLSYYDALYVALAAALDVPLVTKDARLAGAPDLPCAVEVV
ncbi:type II toxin-antitoxin system ribonuclease VapC1 [Pseudonocardia ailaonensis]|uniref:Ribonuclease VapC n=1 Tax=Pseudonocardia ailaonensis TaxID=367279 RepID=A0ABN2MU46_9PSEU